jgi:hypothetical protein
LANTNLKVQTEKGAYVLKICNEKSVEELETQMDALLAMKLLAFPTAYPHIAKDRSNAPNSPISYIYNVSPLRVIAFDFLSVCSSIPSIEYSFSFPIKRESIE